MRRRNLYPIWTWVLWVLVVPMAVLALGIVLLAATDARDLPFDNANLWWLMVLVPLIGLGFLYGVLRRRQALHRFASAELAPLLAARLSPSRQALRAGMTTLAVAMLLFAILGPRWGMYMEKQTVHGIDIVVALDVSRSMLASDVTPDRLTKAKEQIRQQLTERAVFQRAHRLALLAFAGTTSLRLPLTTDHLSFKSKLEDLRVGTVPRGGTAIARAILVATDLFAKSPEQATRIILLFTDGEDHEGGAEEAAKEAFEEHGIRVYTIGIGDPALTAGAEVPSDRSRSARPLLHDGQIVFSKLDVEGLEQIARTAGGRYTPLDELNLLVDAIAKMRKTELTTEERMRHKPRYQWFLVAALLLLGLEMIIGDRHPSERGGPMRIWQQEAA
jgi:Ca-activated chloride channel family protein